MTPTAPCIHCAATAHLRFSAKDYNRQVSRSEFNYYSCGQCNLLFLDPIPTDLSAYYEEAYYEVPKDEGELRRRAESLQQWKIDLVKDHVGGGRLLEIGPAYGLFAYLAKDAGFDVTVIEMDSRCCDFLRTTVGVTVVENSDTIAALETQPLFDVIVAWQVIEHLPNPWDVLAAAAQHLAPGGVIIIDTPNPNAFQFKVLGKYWTHLDAPRHVMVIPVKLLVDHLSPYGLTPVLLTASDKGANGFNGFGWAFSFKNFFGDTPFGRFTHLFGRVLAKLLIPIERTGWRGSTYTAIFRKQA